MSSNNSKATKTNKSKKKNKPKIPTIDEQPESSLDKIVNVTQELKIDDNSEDKNKKKVVVSVKNFVQNTDEVTKLFRSMIGLDSRTSLGATIVRQFSCRNCYKSWWKRIRTYKQVSVCIRCKNKYDPVPFDKEFGICEFKCNICSSQFYKWCSKDGYIQCKKCNNNCQPIKIIINSQNRNITPFNNNNSCSSSSSNSSIVMDGASSNTTTNETIIGVSNNKNYSNRSNYYAQSQSKFFCHHCSDTNINLNFRVIFRPQNYPMFDYYQPQINNKDKPGVSFCSYCRKIPIFSENHISTGSTLASLSYQDDLEIRFLDDEIEGLEPCIEQNSDDEND